MDKLNPRVKISKSGRPYIEQKALVESALKRATVAAQPAQSKSVIKRLAAQGAPATEAKYRLYPYGCVKCGEHPAELCECEHGVLLSMECLNCVEEYVAAPIQATASPASGAQLPDDTVAGSVPHEPESLSSLAREAAEKIMDHFLTVEIDKLPRRSEIRSIIESVFTGSDLYRQGERAGIEAVAQIADEWMNLARQRQNIATEIKDVRGQDIENVVANTCAQIAIAARALLPAGEKSGE